MQDGYLVHLSRTTESTMFGEESASVWMMVEIQKEYRLRVKIYDDKQRFEVPITIPSDGIEQENSDFVIEFPSSPVFGIRVTR